MMEKKVDKINNYFEEQIAACARRGRELLADERDDEAAFEKIKINVYDIFRTMLSVAVKSCQGNPDAVRHFFLQKAEQIPSSRVLSYEKAKQHGDLAKLQIEQIRLDTVKEIKDNFAKIGRKQNDGGAGNPPFQVSVG